MWPAGFLRNQLGLRLIHRHGRSWLEGRKVLASGVRVICVPHAEHLPCPRAYPVDG